MIQVGIGLALQSWAAIILMAVGFAIAHGHRMLLEEKALVLGLGEDYARYMKRTKRLILYII